MFKVHGKWKILARDNYVLQWFGGCWNEEAAIQYCREFQLKTAHLNGTEWAIVSFFDDWELGVPEIEPHVAEHCRLFKENGCRKDCHIYSRTAAKIMQLENIIPHTEGNYERRVFSCETDALAWMKECQFDIDTQGFLDSFDTSS